MPLNHQLARAPASPPPGAVDTQAGVRVSFDGAVATPRGGQSAFSH